MADNHVRRTKEFWIIPIPERLQYDPEKAFHFGLFMNIAFGVFASFTAANIYYSQPILVNLAQAFNVSFDEVSNIPTLVQGGYATGLLFLTPLGDIAPRRQLILLLMLAATAFTIGLAVTNSLIVFEILGYFVGLFTVVPQVLVPLAADLAPVEKRATAVSIVFSGLMFGILIARVLSGVITNFTNYKAVYYLAIGLQVFMLATAYLIVPDYPRKAANRNLSYISILWSMVKIAVSEPVVIVCCLINLAGSACFTAWWVTLTFLLDGPPYHYSTLDIGLFGLLGLFGVSLGPLAGRVVDRFMSWYSLLITTSLLLVFQSVQVIGGGLSIAAVIIACFGLDLFRQTQNVSSATTAFAVQPDARSRINALLTLSLFIGQVMGTSVGSKVFLENGWRACAALGLGWTGFQLLMIMTRGPHTPANVWFGYQGGWSMHKPKAPVEPTTPIEQPVEEKV